MTELAREIFYGVMFLILVFGVGGYTLPKKKKQRKLNLVPKDDSQG